jgi:acyl-CoA synthetase (AMP-forming)/AMP-acid ligase II
MSADPRPEAGFTTEVSTIADLLVHSAREHPDRDALVFPTARYTFAQLDERARHVARGLHALGVRRGDRVGLLAAASVEYVEGFFGVSYLGAVIVPLHARHKASELGYIIENADLVALMTTARPDEYVDFTEVLRRGLPSLGQAGDPARLDLTEAPRLRSVVLLSGGGRAGCLDRDTFDTLAHGVGTAVVEDARSRVRVRDLGAMLYTSGTTANPKGCMLAHEAVTRGPVERARYRLGTGGHDITWAPGPLFHIAALASFLGSIGAGGTFITDEHFEPGRALALMAAERATVAFPWFPAIMQPLLDHPTWSPTGLASLRSMFLIGPSVLLERVQEALPNCELVAACGMTETAGIYAISNRSDSTELRATAQGRACPGVELRIIDVESGHDLGPDHIGEILVRGYNTMEGYHKAPELSAQAIDTEGWLHTGDLYSFTSEGQVVFHGRLKDMLKVGGENVAAVEIESYIARHPAVETVEVVGRPDSRFDEVPVAFVELRGGHSATETEILDFCVGQIARYKIPHAVHFVAQGDWPMSATKINKRELRARLTALAAEVPTP